MFVRSILALVLVALLLLPASARAAGEHVLLALYYPWFSPENFGPGLTSDTPTEPYESDDEPVYPPPSGSSWRPAPEPYEEESLPYDGEPVEP